VEKLGVVRKVGPGSGGVAGVVVVLMKETVSVVCPGL
jgi:hypothetical protein